MHATCTHLCTYHSTYAHAWNMAMHMLCTSLTYMHTTWTCLHSIYAHAHNMDMPSLHLCTCTQHGHAFTPFTHMHATWTYTCNTYLWSVSLSACASFWYPVYIQTNPGPPSHLLPISMKTRCPVFPVLLILSLSHVTTGVWSLGLMMSSCPMETFGIPLRRARMCRPRMPLFEPTSSGRMYTGHTESERGEGRGDWGRGGEEREVSAMLG